MNQAQLNELLIRMVHDITASIRNFEVAKELLNEETPKIEESKELLEASLEQLRIAQRFAKQSMIENILEEDNQGKDAPLT